MVTKQRVFTKQNVFGTPQGIWWGWIKITIRILKNKMLSIFDIAMKNTRGIF